MARVDVGIDIEEIAETATIIGSTDTVIDSSGSDTADGEETPDNGENEGASMLKVGVRSVVTDKMFS